MSNVPFNIINKYLVKIIYILVILNLFGCVPTSKLKYFNDIDTATEPLTNPRIRKVIMPFDKLYIRVVSIDPTANDIFNADDEMRMMGGESGSILGYLVDEKGNINFPFVGEINVLSLTTTQAADKIQNALNDYIPNTSITVKYVDNRVTVLGEVGRQGVYTFSQDKLNIYEAIGMGGGMTRYGDRKNVVIVRHEDGMVKHYQINLSNSKIASSNTYYILPNDVIIVEPLRALSTSYSNITYTTILNTLSPLITVLLFLGFGI